MNLRRAVLTGFVICMTFSNLLFAQTAPNQSVKNLRDRLKKYSRLQFQDLTVYFRPLEFDSCRVKYQYQLTENIGSGLTSSGNSSSPLDTYEQTRLKGATLKQTTATTGNYVILPGRRNEIANLMNVNATSNASIVTSFDFRDLDAASLKIVKRTSGIYLFFQTVKSGDIEKDSFTSENLTVNRGDLITPPVADRKDEYIPVVSEKKAEEIRILFDETIRQCKAS